MQTTTIKVHSSTKAHLDKLREYKNESYDEIISKAVYIVNKLEKEPELSIEAAQKIEEARERIRNSDFLTEDEAREKLGL